MAKLPSPSSPLALGGRGSPAAALGRWLRALGRPGSWGKGAVGCGGSIPPLTSARGGARRRGGTGRWRRRYWSGVAALALRRGGGGGQGGLNVE